MKSAANHSVVNDTNESPLRLVVGYAAMIGIAHGPVSPDSLVWRIVEAGRGDRSSAAAKATGFSSSDILRHVLFALATIIILGRSLGKLLHLSRPAARDR